MTSTDKIEGKESKRIAHRTMINKKEESDPVKKNNPTDSRPLSPSSSMKDSKKQKQARPKPIYFWNNAEVLKWMWRQFSEYHALYGDLFKEHDVTGRTIVRMNDITLEKLGIIDPVHREEIWKEILKLRLKTDMLEMRDLQAKE